MLLPVECPALRCVCAQVGDASLDWAAADGESGGEFAEGSDDADGDVGADADVDADADGDASFSPSGSELDLIGHAIIE